MELDEEDDEDSFRVLFLIFYSSITPNKATGFRVNLAELAPNYYNAYNLNLAFFNPITLESNSVI